YAQQARMYSWLLMTSLLSYWSLWRMIAVEKIKGIDVVTRPLTSLSPEKRADSWRVDLLYILSTAATVYLHYFAFLVPVAQTVFMAIWSLKKGTWRTTRRWITDGLAVLLLFSPWLNNTIA